VTSSTARSLSDLQDELERRFRVVETTLEIGGRTLGLLHPASAEDLINEEDFERDERLPYWAEVWPSARVLAGVLLGMSGKGCRTLELGCGAGLVAMSASLAGFQVCASDYYEDALSFARVNAWRNGATLLETRAVDWRAMPQDLGQFDMVIASDVLYEMSYGELVAQALDATLAPHGTALIADPGRVARDTFIAETRRRGLVVESSEQIAFADGLVRQVITVFRIVRS
jgi:predicted nicotinamide N-methyase